MRWRRLGLFVLGLCLLVGVALFAITTSNRGKLRRQLKEIEERGDLVVLPHTAETEGGRASHEWLRQFDNAEGDENEWSLDREEGVARFLELPEAQRLDEQARAQLRILSACIAREDHDRPEAHSHGLLQDGVPPEQWDECERAFLVACELAYPRLQELLRGEIPSEPLDPEPGPGLMRIPQHIPWLSSAVRAVLLPTHAMLERGDAAGVSARIKKAVQLDALYSRQVSLIALLARVLFTERAVAVARMALAQLPPDAALDSLEPLLAGIEDQRTQFHRALLEERAMMNECFEQVRDGDAPLGDPASGLFATLLSFDQPYFLATFAEAIELSRSDSPVHIGAGIGQLDERIRAHFDSWRKYTTPLAAFLLPRFMDSWHALQDERAMADLVRLGLRVRRLPAQDALAEVAHSSDPYTEQPFHARMETDGHLTLWSVGRNLQDDGAPTHQELERDGETASFQRKFERDDLVVRVRMR